MINIDAAVEAGFLAMASSARAPEIARLFVAEVFCKRNLGSDYVARVVATELVTNVFKHTDTEVVVVRVLCEDGCPVVEVHDEDDEVPVVECVGGEAESGRGLLMMSMLVEAWGVQVRPGGGKVVWARLGRG